MRPDRRAGQFEAIAGQSNDEDPGLDRTLDVKHPGTSSSPDRTPRPLLGVLKGRIGTGIAAFGDGDESIQVEDPAGLVDVPLLPR